MTLNQTQTTLYTRLINGEPDNALSQAIYCLTLTDLSQIVSRLVSDVGDTTKALDDRKVTGPEWPHKSRALLRHAWFNHRQLHDRELRWKNGNSFRTSSEHDMLISRHAPLGFDDYYAQMPDLRGTLWSPGVENSRSRVVSDDIWILVGCSVHRHGWTVDPRLVETHWDVGETDESLEAWKKQPYNGKLQVHKNSENPGEVVGGDNCILIYANNPDAFEYLGPSTTVHFRYYKLDYDAEKEVWCLKEMKNHPTLPELDWNKREQLIKSIVFLQDFFGKVDFYQNIDSTMTFRDRKWELFCKVKHLIRLFIMDEKWMGVSTG